MSSEYQGSLNQIVDSTPIAEAEYVTKTNSAKDKILFLTIFVLYISLWKIKKLFG